MEAVRRLTGMRPRKVKGEWVYPHSADVLAAAHLQAIEYYLQKHRYTVYNPVHGRGVLKECEGAEWRRGTPPCLFWVEQDMAVPERREYGAEGKGSIPPPPPPRRHIVHTWPRGRGPLS